jgi:hypothetical protein
MHNHDASAGKPDAEEAKIFIEFVSNILSAQAKMILPFKRK